MHTPFTHDACICLHCLSGPSISGHSRGWMMISKAEKDKSKAPLALFRVEFPPQASAGWIFKSFRSSILQLQGKLPAGPVDGRSSSACEECPCREPSGAGEAPAAAPTDRPNGVSYVAGDWEAHLPMEKLMECFRLFLRGLVRTPSMLSLVATTTAMQAMALHTHCQRSASTAGDADASSSVVLEYERLSRFLARTPFTPQIHFDTAPSKSRGTVGRREEWNAWACSALWSVLSVDDAEKQRVSQCIAALRKFPLHRQLSGGLSRTIVKSSRTHRCHMSHVLDSCRCV